MRVCFVGEKDLRSFSDTLDIDDEADLILFGFNGVGEVSYERELKGQTKYFEDIAVLSKKAKNIVARVQLFLKAAENRLPLRYKTFQR